MKRTRMGWIKRRARGIQAEYHVARSKAVREAWIDWIFWQGRRMAVIEGGLQS